MDAKAFARLFSIAHKGFIFGAFTRIREADIVKALELGEMFWKETSGVLRACAMVHELSLRGRFRDFAGREFEIPKGHARCSAFACATVEAGAALLGELRERAKGRFWLEIFEEDALARSALDRFPEIPYVATRVASTAEIKGIYTDAVTDAAELHPAERASLAVLARDFINMQERDEMLKEIAAYARASDPWADHYSLYNLRKSWTAFALRGYDPQDPRDIVKPREMTKAWQAEHPDRINARCDWTTACASFPRSMQVVERVLAGRDADRVRFMRLAPRGELSRHTDIQDLEAGLRNYALARLHLPLHTSWGVVVHGWDKRGAHVTTRFPERALCYLDHRGPHRVQNLDAECQRIHLVIDVHSDERLRTSIEQAMSCASA